MLYKCLLCRLQDRLAEVEEDGSINYTKFLERYRVQVKRVGTPKPTSSLLSRKPTRRRNCCCRLRLGRAQNSC